MVISGFGFTMVWGLHDFSWFFLDFGGVWEIWDVFWHMLFETSFLVELCWIFEKLDGEKHMNFPKQCLHLRGSYLLSIEGGWAAGFFDPFLWTCLGLPRLV